MKSIKYLLFLGLYLSVTACMAPQEIEENCEVACDWAHLGEACQQACEMGAYRGKECWTQHSDVQKGYVCADTKCKEAFGLDRVREFVPSEQTLVPTEDDITDELLGFVEDTNTLRLACQRAAEKAIDHLDAVRDRQIKYRSQHPANPLKYGSCDRFAGGITRCY